jgi:hypothetical protein
MSQLLSAAFLDPEKSVSMPTSVFDLIEEKFSLDFDKALTKLEHREFVCDDQICHEENCDAASFWLKVRSQKSLMGSPKYANLSLHWPFTFLQFRHL